ncbi:MAG: DUF2318 domain-containing protein [Deltaproteobacteria bacterium]|jgi:uncharacterized membrane protein|nr:DUF2318 domain-containing protein [Deltaproteobacteria bacterium]
MSHKKKQSIKEVSTNKKAAVLGNEKKKKKIVPYTVLSICAILVIAAVVFFQGNVQSSQNRSVVQNVGQGNKGLSQVQVVTYPTTLFDEGKAKHFEFRTDNGITVKYFVLKSSDGVIRAAFDACDVCWPSGKGYYQEGDKMVCRNCGKRFASVKINVVKGGCNPAPLNRKIDGDNLVIQVADILEGQSYFDFKGRG